MEFYENLDPEEQLKAENAFLQMKLMLENGAQFMEQKDGANNLSAESENQFLKNMIDFDKQFNNAKSITVFEKIEKPTDFKPSSLIPDSEIDQAWLDLSAYMGNYGVNLDVCSPNITARTLYRFTTEELFNHEMDAINMPGWTTNFIYDEFHPDYIYDNAKLITEDILPEIFSPHKIEYTIHYNKTGVRFNERIDLTDEDLKILLNDFKATFDKLKLTKTKNVTSEIVENNCTVSGWYSASGKAGETKIFWKGNFDAQLIFNEEYGYWYIIGLDIEGLSI